jgi:carboxymethylenebutenolidase
MHSATTSRPFQPTTPAAVAALVTGLLLALPALATVPQTVYFPAADGSTELVGYLYQPEGGARHPAVVLLHGRAGPYSSNVNTACSEVRRDRASPCSAQTLSERHQMWGEYWASHGYAALLVDSFGPRGRAHGYGRGTHDDPDREAVNELTVRPQDAEAALTYLVARPDVRPERVMLQGWSNGGSTTLNTMQRQSRSQGGRAKFAAALAFYPGCGPKTLLARTLQFNAPVTLFLGSADEEVSPTICRKVASRSGGVAAVHWYEPRWPPQTAPLMATQTAPGRTE